MRSSPAPPVVSIPIFMIKWPQDDVADVTLCGLYSFPSLPFSSLLFLPNFLLAPQYCYPNDSLRYDTRRHR